MAVSPAENEFAVKLFRRLPERYDLLAEILSFGQNGRWRAELGVPSSVFLLAWLDWEAAGTGVSHSLKGAAELVGIVTQKALRRRGVAATITSELVRRHFDRGGDFVFLDAAGDEAAKVYAGLGFSPFGVNLVYR